MPKANSTSSPTAGLHSAAIATTDARLVQLKRELAGQPFDTQMALLAPGRAEVHDAAAHGTRSGGGKLPHGEAIQRAFGHHDIGNIQAHTDSAAQEGARAMGAEAFASGDHVAFDGAPTLHTAAHEAAHVIQQRAGVSLKGGVGAEYDGFENHADAVADLVVQGKSAEPLLDVYANSGVVSSGVENTEEQVQRKPNPEGTLTENDVPEKKSEPESKVPQQGNGTEIKEPIRRDENKEPKQQLQALGYTEVRVLAENQNQVYHVKTNDGQDLVLKFQSMKSQIDEYLLGSLATEIGLSYLSDDISIHPAGSAEEKQHRVALREHGKNPAGAALMIMPHLAVEMNKMVDSPEFYRQLGRTFAFEIFTSGKDRFPVEEAKGYNNLFTVDGELNMLDSTSALSNGNKSNAESYRTDIKLKLAHETRKRVFNKSWAMASGVSNDPKVAKKIRSMRKQDFHQGIRDGMNDILSHQQEITERFNQIAGKYDKNGDISYLISFGPDQMFAELRRVLAQKKSMKSEGNVYKFALGD